MSNFSLLFICDLFYKFQRKGGEVPTANYKYKQLVTFMEAGFKPDPGERASAKWLLDHPLLGWCNCVCCA